jgi:hypothetical protein
LALIAHPERPSTNGRRQRAEETTEDREEGSFPLPAAPGIIDIDCPRYAFVQGGLCGGVQ